MMKQKHENHLKKIHLSYINGPMLFTAPHSKKLKRGGKLFNQEVRIHLRQQFTSYLAVQLAKTHQKASFCCWGVSSVLGEDLDPNFLIQPLFEFSVFHQCLQYWASKYSGIPLLHIDIHGKYNRKADRQIDVGIRSMEVHWGKDPLIQDIRNHFKKLNSIFNGYEFDKFECNFNCSPFLNGYWGGFIHTMTEQAIKMGIPSLQLQIPKSIRKALFKDDKLRTNLAMGLKQLYTNIIIPHYNQLKRQVKIVKQIAIKFKPTIDKTTIKECSKQLFNWEEKQSLKLTDHKL